MTTPLGQYRHLVQVVVPGLPTADPDGGWSDTWVPVNPPMWHCAIEAASQRDLARLSGGTISTTATHLVRGRYHPQLGANARILFRGRTFEVQSAHDWEQRQIEIELICAEVTSTAIGPTTTPPARYDDVGQLTH